MNRYARDFLIKKKKKNHLLNDRQGQKRQDSMFLLIPSPNTRTEKTPLLSLEVTQQRKTTEKEKETKHQ